MQIVGGEVPPPLKLRWTGARDLSSVGLAEEDSEVKIACKQASYTDHLMASLATSAVRVY
jgi:hypothetical protein